MKDLAISGLLVMGAICRREETAGIDIITMTNLKSGTVYPLLKNLERSGYIRSRVEDGTPQGRGRPLRTFYRATAKGRKAASSQAARLKPTLDYLVRVK